MTPTPAPSDPNAQTPISPHLITYLLLGATIFFSLVLIAIDKLFPNEGQVFQVIANLTSGFAGAFFTRIQPLTHAVASAISPPANGGSGSAAAVPPLPIPNLGAAAAALQGALGAASPSPGSSPSPGPTPIKPLGMQP